MKKLFGPSIKHTERFTKILKNHIYSLIMCIINESCIKSVLMAADDVAINITSFE